MVMSRKNDEKMNLVHELGCSHTDSSFARSWQAGWQAGFGKHGNTLESTH